MALALLALAVLAFLAVVLGHHPDSKVVIILGANKGGGVLQWKGAKDWEVERMSIANKKAYAKRHGYSLAVKDMTAKKRYSHEWRESWEKVDVIREVMRQFPKAEWFWWIDLESYIMEPSVSLEKQVFSKLDRLERNMSYYNPKKFDQEIAFLDSSAPVDMVLAQDCGGPSLGSFFLRRSRWTDLLLDLWWDPVLYEQKHQIWEHNEQSSFEYLYENQAWIRNRVGLAPLRQINAFPHGACADVPGDQRFFYQRGARDFVVNMAGCQFGRDCWQEMSDFQALSKKLNKRRFWVFW